MEISHPPLPMPIRFDHPELLWLLLLAVPMAWWAARALRAFDPVRRWAAIGLRVMVLTLIVLMLAGLQSVRWHDGLTVVAVLNESDSMRQLAQPPPWPLADPPPQRVDAWTRLWLSQAGLQRQADDRLAVVTYDAQPTVRLLPSAGMVGGSGGAGGGAGEGLGGAGLIMDWGSAPQPVEGTDTAAAIRLGMALYQPDAARRMVLISDGNDPRPSEVLLAAQQAAAAGVPIDVLPIDYRLDREVMVEAVHVPTEAREGQTISLRVVLRAARPAGGLLHLRHDHVPVMLGGDQQAAWRVTPADWTMETATVPGDADVVGGRFVLVRRVQVPMRHAGVGRFEAIFEPDAGQDTVAANNRAEAFTLVHGRGQVLVADGIGGASGSILPDTLQRAGLDVQVVAGGSLPADMAALQRYDAVVLQNVPAMALTVQQQRMMQQYVTELGGGLVMVGGPASFGAGGWANTPVDDILPVTSEIPSQMVVPAGALVLVIDRSGSMREIVAGAGLSRQVMANEAAVLAIQSLTNQDYAGVIAFDSRASWVVPLRLNDQPRDTMQRVQAIEPAGGTHIYPGLVEATEALSALTSQQASVKHIILLTDGMDNQGLTSDYPGIVARMRQQNITLTTIGIGEAHEIDAPLLEQLARDGGGFFYHVEDGRQLPRVLIHEARLVRQHLIKEVPFQPQVRQGSPLISGLTDLPPLRGLVLTGARSDPRVYMPMVSPDGEPVFAHWQAGLGQVAAFTSDATNRWAGPWMSWPGYADFWVRTVRGIARPTASRDFDLQTSLDGPKLHVRLDAAGVTEQAAGSAGVSGSLLLPSGQPMPLRLEQTGPGLYETTVDAPDPGSYVVSLLVEQPNGQRHHVLGGATRPPSAQLRQFESNRYLLEQIAQTTGGRVLPAQPPEPDVLFARDGTLPPSRSIQPLWRTLLPWLLALLLMDVACRRIAWDAQQIRQWIAQRLAAWRALLNTPQQQAEQTLARLRSRARQVQQESPAPSTPLADASQRSTQRFESQAPAGKPIITAAQPPSPPPTANPSDQPDPPQDGATTSRLLDAKRRARQRMLDDHQS